MPNTSGKNGVKTWNDLQTKYKIKTQDTDMGFGPNKCRSLWLSKMQHLPDIGDVGFEFGEIAKKRGITDLGSDSGLGQGSGWSLVPCLHRHGGIHHQ